jgi:NAD-dependent DNA ligase
MSDLIFDFIKSYIENINPHHPVLKHIGASIVGSNKVKLPYFMGSLDKIKNDDKALKIWKSKYDGNYVISDKLDGNSGMLVIHNNKISLFTRGDGTYGQDISHLVPFLKSKFDMSKINSYIKSKKIDKLCLRGELIISKNDWKTVSYKGANARNMVAGLLNSKIPDLQLASITSFVAYEVVHPLMIPIGQMQLIKEINVECVEHSQLNTKTLSTETLSDILIKRRGVSPYEIDGIVVAHNQIYERVNENPEYAFAFKSILTMETAEVTVTKVEWNMSKDAIYVPVVHFTPVSLDGVVISKAHGFNGKYIKDNSIGPGAVILIMRSGAVIPYIIQTLVKSEHTQFPEAPFVWSTSGVEIKLDTSQSSIENNDILAFRNLVYFFDKVDVYGLSEGILSKLFKNGFKTVGKILNLDVTDLKGIDGFQDKLANKIVDALKNKKQQLDPILVMDASNVLGRGIGYKKIKVICDAFPRIISDRYIPTVQELITIKSIEEKTASLFVSNLAKVFAFFDKNNIPLKAEVKILKTIESTLSNSMLHILKDKHFVFTGARDKALEDIIIKNGGIIQNSVSTKTTNVIVKSLDFQSSKTIKAKQLGVSILTLDDFKSQLQL